MKLSHTLNVLVGFRKSRDITQLQLSECMKLSRMMVNSIENEKRSLTFDTVGAYLKSLNNWGKVSQITEEEWSLFVEAYVKDTFGIFSKILDINIQMDNDIGRVVLYFKKEFLC